MGIHQNIYVYKKHLLLKNLPLILDLSDIIWGRTCDALRLDLWMNSELRNALFLLASKFAWS